MLNLDYEYGIELVWECLEQTQEEALWELWLSDNANAHKQPKPYKDYLAEYRKNKTRNIERINEPSSDELFAMAEKIKHSG
ncbi:hypothetical protein HXA31_20410 [Salipaludibacillus agaradhaerens]|uniref:Uncharacterized protein n=1 Tax=Salipaludibacillus agaradhaerens TaxID=76935 RepID=A0A9Q4B278_SALAG|nr:hypothetical protein [Salipaludibacillus agaradhaerens]MCR6096851.1 hypothetical protein [Salipaludibacillus agaradhaerens]MCR6116695.1 hypothetical protein [Salipaludibacillus agaradhaerens]